ATAWLVVNDRAAAVSADVELPPHLLPGPGVGLWAMDPATGVESAQAFSPTAGGLRTTLRLDHTQAVVLTARVDARAVLAPPAEAETPGHATELRDWTIQLVPHALDSRWTDTAKAQWVPLPVWKALGRGWRRLEGWTQPGYDDSAWRPVAVTRGRAMLDDEVALLRTPLPPGARAIRLPLPASGEYMLHVNGRLVEKRLGPAHARGTLDIAKWVTGGNDVVALEVSAMQSGSGLEAAPEVLCGETPLGALAGWDSLHLGWYSGRAVYRTEATLRTAPRGPVWLDLGRVEHYAEVWINGRLATTLLWPPYRVEIGSLLRRGRNRIALVVSNSIAGRFVWDDWGTRDGRSWGVGPAPEASGLIGPVTLTRWRLSPGIETCDAGRTFA
ncbi:MAG: hypothetical protein NT031_02715, partial [Planctomycetota bacterium]|nr:hypothetical protein [Planctomycetota bacterium]